jgi:phi LC3 family holin
MIKINWGVRFKNKLFWYAIIPAILVLIKSVAEMFGFTIDLTTFEQNMLSVVEAVFVILAILGIVADPTTAGYSDSKQALTYKIPRE